ncbi:MAG: 23S rRNA (pseudouridine(1915)-N(3))-methyltransferase RlmH [Clostridia bacterium]|nr:23S rRNA (pseudouridine(1915)-N(3))-methyltransferase RlmH [Clostridia bacterium]
MATVTLISVGTLKEAYLKDAVGEYKKRLSQYARLDQIELKEERIVNEDDPSEINRALEKEGERILTSIPKGSTVAALCVEGKEYSSVELAELVCTAVNTTGKLTLIIGSSHGLADSVKRAADIRLSFSRLTFPHQLMQVILLEAMYRSFTIIAGKKYHK